MKIAFWSEAGHSGTTSNMLAVSTMVSAISPGSRVTLRSLGKPERAEGKKEREITHTVGHTSNERQSAERMSKEEKAQSGYVFLDCGSGLDACKRHILSQADMIVVNVRQREEELNRLFLEHRCLLAKSMVLVGNYCEQSEISRRYLEHMYRIEPEHLGVVSYNSEFYQACLRGRVRHFVKSRQDHPGCMRNSLFIRELEQFAQRLMIQAERKSIQG